MGASPSSEVVYRTATEADLEPGYAVFNRAQKGLYQRRGFEWIDRSPEMFIVPQRHVQATDPGRSFVAEVGGEVVAYASAIARGPAWFFSALFVDPAHQGRGIGRTLFELCAKDWPERRITIVDAHQRVSTGLYTSQGLIPSTPILVLGGVPRMSAPPDLEPGETDPASLAALDAAAYGFDRAIDHAFWARTGEGTLWRRGGEPVAYAYVSPSGWVGPLAGRDDESAIFALRAELARRPQVTLGIPGSAAALVEVAFAAGLRIVHPTGILLHSRPATLPTSLAISGYWLL